MHSSAKFGGSKLIRALQVVAGSQRSVSGSSAISWSIHAQGQVELLRLRGPSQLQKPMGQNIFWLLAMSIQMRTLITGEEYPSFIQDWSILSQDQISGLGLSFFGLSSFAHDLSIIGKRVREALTTDDTQFLPWTITDLWNKLLILQATLDQALYDHPLGEPIHLKNLYISNMYRTYYTRTLQHMLDLAESPQAEGNSSIPPGQLDTIVSSIKSIVQSLASATLSTVPAILTAYGADQGPEAYLLESSMTCCRPVCWPDVLKLLWPLRILSARKQLLSDAQVELSQLVLQRISEDFGIRQAVATYHLLDRPPGG